MVTRATPPEKRSQTVGIVAAVGSLGTMVLAPVGQALGHRGYFFMTPAFFACGVQLVFLTTHLPAYLQLCGIVPVVSATALGLIGLFNAIGTYGFGLLGARYSQKHLLAGIYLFRTLFIIAFLSVPISATTTLIFAAAMGALWLGVTRWARSSARGWAAWCSRASATTTSPGAR